MSRIERINAELQKQLSIVLRDGINDPRVAGKMICVTDVEVDSDLTLANNLFSTVSTARRDISNPVSYLRSN